MAGGQFTVVKSDVLSTPYQARWVIADAKTGEVLNDAQGCGYRSPETADAALWFRFRTPARLAGEERKKQAVRAWTEAHKDFMACMRHLDRTITRGDYGPDGVFNAYLIAEYLHAAGYDDLPFSAANLVKYGIEGGKQNVREKDQSR